MDFEDFAEQFRRRTARRLVEFEKTLEKAQRDMEKAATRAAADAQREVRKPVQHATPPAKPLDYRTPEIRGGWKPQQPETTQPEAMQPLAQQKPAPRRTPGKVKSVLRRSLD